MSLFSTSGSAAQRLPVGWPDAYRLPHASPWAIAISSSCPTAWDTNYLLLGALFVLGTNYQNNLVLALAYLLLSLFITTLIYCHQNMVGITLSSLPTPAHYVGYGTFCHPARKPDATLCPAVTTHRPGHSRAWPLRKERRQQNRLVLNEELPVLDQASTLGYSSPLASGHTPGRTPGAVKPLPPGALQVLDPGGSAAGGADLSQAHRLSSATPGGGSWL